MTVLNQTEWKNFPDKLLSESESISEEAFKPLSFKTEVGTYPISKADRNRVRLFRNRIRNSSNKKYLKAYLKG